MKLKGYLTYGVATFADAGPYSFTTTYLILFLTTVAAISPETAGTITSLIILISGFGEAVIGYISDNTKSRRGRRRPFLIVAVLPLGIGLAMLFHVFDFGNTVNAVLYIVFGGLFWAGYGMYYTPYAALGAEITDDYDERSTLRSYARVFGILGNVVGMVVPLLLISILGKYGISEGSAWQIMAIIISLISCISILITYRSTEGKERPAPESQVASRGVINIIRDYFCILKLKPFKYLIGVIAAFMAANTFYSSTMVFFTRYKLGMDDEITSTVFLISMVVNLVLTPIFAGLSLRVGKKTVMAAALAIAGVGCMAFKFIDMGTYGQMVVYVCIFSIAYASFWQLFNSIVYDISEVGEYVTGKRLEGSILSVSSIIMAISMSLATKVLGGVLGACGYDSTSAVQSADTIAVITDLFTFIPGACLVVAAICMILYPLNKKRYDNLKIALNQKNKGAEQDETILRNII